MGCLVVVLGFTLGVTLGLAVGLGTVGFDGVGLYAPLVKIAVGGLGLAGLRAVEGLGLVGLGVTLGLLGLTVGFAGLVGVVARTGSPLCSNLFLSCG